MTPPSSHARTPAPQTPHAPAEPTLAAYVAQRLHALGHRVCFTLPGATVYPLLDELALRGFDLITAPHEQALAHMAEGHAVATGRPGLVVVTGGPGLTNTITAIANARWDFRPLLVIAGDVASAHRGTGAFQDLGPGLTLGPGVVKREQLIALDNGQTRFDVDAAHDLALDDPPGPVLAWVPVDAWAARPAAPPPVIRHRPDRRALPAPTHAEFADLIGSPRTVALLGAGIREPATIDAITRCLADRKIPAAFSMGAVGRFDPARLDALGLFGAYGVPPAHRALLESTAVLGLGVRLNNRAGGLFRELGQRPRLFLGSEIWQPAVPGPDTSRHIDEPDLARLLNALPHPSPALLADRDAWINRLRSTPIHTDPTGPSDPTGPTAQPSLSLESAVATVLEAIPKADMLIADCGNHQVAAARLLALRPGPRFETTRGFGVMGFAIAAAAGHAIGSVARTWALIGDGGFAASTPALETIAQLNLPVALVVIDDRAYGMVRDGQRSMFQGRTAAAARHLAPSPAAIASGYGLTAAVASSQHQLADALRHLPHDRPTLIEVRVDPDAPLRPFHTPGGGLMAFA